MGMVSLNEDQVVVVVVNDELAQGIHLARKVLGPRFDSENEIL
jgi:hypothetical protein